VYKRQIYSSATFVYRNDIIHEGAELGKVCHLKDGQNVVISKKTDSEKTLISKLDERGNYIYHNTELNLGYTGNAQIMESAIKDGQTQAVGYTLYHKNLGKEYVFFEMDSKHIALVINFETAPSSEEILQTASSYLDMLETEAFTSFKLSYSKAVSSFKELPSAYNDAITAMEIGNTFNSHGRIYSYEDLGLGRLLYNVPPSEIKAYLNKHINIDILSQIDAETLSLINAFFEHDLSLAETARQTFIHRNTLIYRLDKFADLTGYDVRKFSDAITVKISLMLYNYIKAQ